MLFHALLPGLPNSPSIRCHRLSSKLPLTTFSSVKRLIGRSLDDPIVQEEARRLPYGIGKDAEGAVTLQCPGIDSVERGYLYPEEVSAQVLARLISDAESFTKAPPGSIKKAIISVPAYFDAKQRQATMDAGESTTPSVKSVNFA